MENKREIYHFYFLTAIQPIYLLSTIDIYLKICFFLTIAYCWEVSASTLVLLLQPGSNIASSPRPDYTWYEGKGHSGTQNQMIPAKKVHLWISPASLTSRDTNFPSQARYQCACLCVESLSHVNSLRPHEL